MIRNNPYSSFDKYGLRYLPGLLVERGRVDKLKKILLDFDWLVAKMYELVSTQPLFDDYNLLSPSEGSVFASIQQTLSQNSQIFDLCESMEELASTLYSRLVYQKDIIDSLSLDSRSLPRSYIIPFPVNDN